MINHMLSKFAIKLCIISNKLGKSIATGSNLGVVWQSGVCRNTLTISSSFTVLLHNSKTLKCYLENKQKCPPKIRFIGFKGICNGVYNVLLNLIIHRLDDAFSLLEE